MSRRPSRVVIPRVFDLSIEARKPSVEVPLMWVMQRGGAEPDFQRAVEIAPDVWITIMGVGDLVHPVDGHVETTRGARIGVWADPLVRPLSLGPAAAALGVEVPTMRLWAQKGWVPSWKTLGGHRRFDPAVLQAVKEGVPLRQLAATVTRLRDARSRRAS